jgi:hypothetical protein
MTEHVFGSDGICNLCGESQAAVLGEQLAEKERDLAAAQALVGELEQTLANVRESHAFQWEEKHKAEDEADAARAEASALRWTLTMIQQELDRAADDGVTIHFSDSERAIRLLVKAALAAAEAPTAEQVISGDYESDPVASYQHDEHIWLGIEPALPSDARGGAE